MAVVYISSTFKDLQEHREQVYRALRKMRHDVIAMEDYVARDDRPLDKCLADVEKCDVYIGIFAWRYGYIPAEDNPEQKSITELEFRHAIETGKHCLIFLLDQKASWPMEEVEWEARPRILSLREELSKKKMVSFFDSAYDLAASVSAAVHVWQMEHLDDKAQGRDPLGLLREIRKATLRQGIGEEPEELVTLGGTTVARNSLATVIDGNRVLDIQNKPVAAAAFASFFEDREHDPGEARTTEDAKGIDINPQPLTASEKPREVFISYAWGDDKTRKGKTRAQVVDALTAALTDDGFHPVRDRDQIRPGDQISAFIRRLTRADLVVAVISDKYLRSSYCMYEIYKLWQKSQTDADQMVERLVPIVLPEVKIGSFEERAPYLEHWSERAAKLEALIRNPNLRPSAESWEEVRRVREFAHHVDDILVFLQDVLMPRKLEAHLDDGFQAVREALRRRM